MFEHLTEAAGNVRVASRIKILHVITGSGIGGSERMLYELVTRLDSERFEPMVCSLKPAGYYGGLLKEAGVPFFSLDMPEGGGMQGVRATMRTLYRLLMLVISLSPHLIHTFLFRANQIGRFIGWVQDVPVISSIRTMEMEKAYHHACDGRTSFMVARYTAVSDAVRDFTIDRSGLKPEKIVTIPNGIDTTPFDGLVRDEGLFASFGLGSSDRVICSVGRLRREKGFPVLLQAFCDLAGEFPDTKLLIVGEGEEGDSLRTLAGELGVGERVLFAGARTDIPAIMSGCNIFVLPSLWEGMPNVVLEAMAAGRPVVATNVGGIPEVVVDAETGLLVPPSDVAALANALGSLLRDPAWAQDMGALGRERVVRHFDIRTTVRKTEDLYMRVLRQRGVTFP